MLDRYVTIAVLYVQIVDFGFWNLQNLALLWAIHKIIIVGRPSWVGGSIFNVKKNDEKNEKNLATNAVPPIQTARFFSIDILPHGYDDAAVGDDLAKMEGTNVGRGFAEHLSDTL